MDESRIMTKNYDDMTDDEWIVEQSGRLKFYTVEVVVEATIRAYEEAISEFPSDLDLKSSIDASDIIDANSNSGIAIGAKRSATTTFKMFNFEEVERSVTRTYADGRKREISFTGADASGNIYSHKGGGKSVGLKIGKHLEDAALHLSGTVLSSTNIDPEIKKRSEEQAALNEANKKLDTKVTEAVQVLFDAEFAQLKELNKRMDTKGSDFKYATDKHSHLDPEKINDIYKNALSMPDNFDFFNRGTDDLIKSDDVPDPIERGNKIRDALTEQLETVMAHIDTVDPSHPLLAAYEAEHDEVRSLTADEDARLKGLFASKLPDVNTNQLRMFLPSYNVADLGNPDATPQAGQVFSSYSSGSFKGTVKDLSISNSVHVVGGDPLKPVDEIFFAEGIATAGSVEEIISKTPDYNGKNVLVLSTYDANNFEKVGESLYRQYPNIPVNGVADNDIWMRVDSGNRPILDDQGDYRLITKDNEDISPKALVDMSPKEQYELLKNNAGAKAAQRLNTLFINKPNFNSDGDPLKPLAVAFVVNKGEKLTDFILQARSPFRADKEPHELLKSQKRDINDVYEDEKKYHLKDAEDSFKIAEMPFDKDMRDSVINSVAENVMQNVIQKPLQEIRAKFDVLFERRVASGFYHISEDAVANETTNQQAIDNMNRSNHSIESNEPRYKSRFKSSDESIAKREYEHRQFDEVKEVAKELISKLPINDSSISDSFNQPAKNDPVIQPAPKPEPEPELANERSYVSSPRP